MVKKLQVAAGQSAGWQPPALHATVAALLHLSATVLAPLPADRTQLSSRACRAPCKWLGRLPWQSFIKLAARIPQCRMHQMATRPSKLSCRGRTCQGTWTFSRCPLRAQDTLHQSVSGWSVLAAGFVMRKCLRARWACRWGHPQQLHGRRRAHHDNCRDLVPQSRQDCR